MNPSIPTLLVASLSLAGSACGSDATGDPASEADADIAVDASDTLADAARPDAMPVGNSFALSFDGLDDRLVTGAFTGLAGASGYTIEAWVKPASTDNKGAILWQNRGGPGSSFGMVRTSIGQGEVSVGASTISCIVFGGSAVFLSGQWTHIAGTWSGPSGAPSLYLNGQLINQSGCSSGIAEVANDLLIGAAVVNAEVTNHFEGLIDEVRIWDHARTQQAIESARGVLLSGEESGLVAYWNFDQGTGDTALDSAGGHDARLGSSTGGDDGDPLWVNDTPF